MDLAVVKIRNYENIQVSDSFRELIPLQISKNKVNLLDTIYSVTFSYFDKKEILNEIIFPNIFKGVVTKKIIYRSVRSVCNTPKSMGKNKSVCLW
jgi:hypothetical protein